MGKRDTTSIEGVASRRSSLYKFILNTMRSEINPFCPGSGLKPPLLVGREAEIDAFDLLVARSRGQKPARGIVLHGYRGVGKTVLLNAMRAQAENAGWLVVELEGQISDSGRASLPLRLSRSLDQAALRFRNGKVYSAKVKSALGTLKSFSLSLGSSSLGDDIAATPGRANSGQLELDLDELIEDFAPALRESNSAIGIFIDEMQDVDSELLGALVSAQHRAGQNSIPFYILGAGLPSLPGILNDSRSYAERLFDYRHIDALTQEAAKDALVIPAARLGVTIRDAAANILVDESGRYPYFVQTYGQAVWDVAPLRQIDVNDANEAIVVGRRRLDEGFFPARWDRATPAERDYLKAMARLSQPTCKTSEVAGFRKSTVQALSMTRKSLIQKGIIFAPERGSVAFTVPGMPAFIGRQEDEEVF